MNPFLKTIRVVCLLLPWMVGAAQLSAETNDAVYWKLWGQKGELWSPDLMNIVGVNSNENAMTDPEGRWFEPIAPLSLFPINLYQAQLERRLGEDKN